MPSSSSPCPDVNDTFRLRVFRPKGVTGAVTDSLPYDPFSKLKSGSARLTDKLFSKGAAMLLDAFLQVASGCLSDRAHSVRKHPR